MSVRAHERDIDPDPQREVPEWSRPVHVSQVAPAAPEPAAEDWWADEQPEPVDSSEEETRMKWQMREWRARDVPLLPREPMTPQMEQLLGCDTPEGRESFERLRAYREAGYDGPLGPDNRIPDPDDPAEQESISALAYMRAQGGA